MLLSNEISASRRITLPLFDTRPTTRDVTICTPLFIHVVRRPRIVVSYALQRLDSPELRPIPEQRPAIESVYRGKDVLSVPTGNNRFVTNDSSRYTVLSVNLVCIPVVLNDATLFSLLTKNRHKRQAFTAEIVILAHRYARSLSLE